MEKFTRLTKLGNEKSARRQLDKVFALMLAGKGKSKDPATPKKKATPTKRKKGESFCSKPQRKPLMCTSVSDEDDDSEETPAKKAAAEESKESEVEENGDGEKVKGEDGFF